MPNSPSTTGNCNHCGGPIAVRNPTGKCDHLHYPENCPACLAEGKYGKDVLDAMNKLPDSGGGEEIAKGQRVHTCSTADQSEEVERLLNEALSCYVATWHEEKPQEVRKDALKIREYVRTLQARNKELEGHLKKLGEVLRAFHHDESCRIPIGCSEWVCSAFCSITDAKKALSSLSHSTKALIESSSPTKE